MQLYADSADVDRVLPLLRAGLVVGVTSNPTILDRSDRGAKDFVHLYETFVEAGAQEVFFQTWGATAEAMVANAHPVRALGDRAVVKLPATLAGFAAASAVRRAGTPTLVTAVNTVAQCVLSAQVGATYVAPYFGQIGDRTGEPPVELIARMVQALAGTGTHVLLASVRTPEVVEQAVAVGVRHVTANPDVIEALAADEHTEQAARLFEDVMSRRA